MYGSFKRHVQSFWHFSLERWESIFLLLCFGKLLTPLSKGLGQQLYSVTSVAKLYKAIHLSSILVTRTLKARTLSWQIRSPIVPRPPCCEKTQNTWGGHMVILWIAILVFKSCHLKCKISSEISLQVILVPNHQETPSLQVFPVEASR